MAFYIDEEEQNQGMEGEQSFSPGGQSSQLGGVGGTGVGGGSTSKSTPDNPGNFVGLKQYLDANQRQSEKLGSDVAGKVSGAIGEAKSNIQNLGSQFQNRAQSGLISNFENAGQEAQGIVNQAATANKQALPGQEQIQRFGQIANAQYQGPKNIQDIEEFNPTLQSVTEAQRLSGLAGTEEGKEGLVRSVANPQSKYSQGQARLDSYLLATEPNRQKLQEARQGFEQVDPMFQQQKEQAQNLVQDLQKKNEDLRTQARIILEGTSLSKKANVQSDLAKIEQQIAQNNKKAQDYRNIFTDTSDKGSVSLTAQQMKELGIEPGSINRLYGALNNNPNQFIPYNQVFDPNAAISIDDQARLSALAELSGTFGGDFTNPFAASQVAGTLNPQDPFANTGSALQQEVARREAIYNQGVQNFDFIPNNLRSNPVYQPDQLSRQGLNDPVKLMNEANKLAAGSTGAFKQHYQSLANYINDWLTSKGYYDTMNIKSDIVPLPKPVLGGA